MPTDYEPLKKCRTGIPLAVAKTLNVVEAAAAGAAVGLMITAETGPGMIGGAIAGGILGAVANSKIDKADCGAIKPVQQAGLLKP